MGAKGPSRAKFFFGGEMETEAAKNFVGSMMPRMSAMWSCQEWLLKPSTIRTRLGLAALIAAMAVSGSRRRATRASKDFNLMT